MKFEEETGGEHKEMEKKWIQAEETDCEKSTD
jgi:hypothetical protein